MIVEETWKPWDFLKPTESEVKRHKVNILKSCEHYLGNVGEEKRWRCSGYCQHRYATSNTAESCSSAFSGNFCCTNVWVHAEQRRSKARTSSYLLAKPRMFSSPPPQKSQTTSKSQLQKCLTKATFLWINIKNRPQELDLKKIIILLPWISCHSWMLYQILIWNVFSWFGVCP